MKRTLIQQRSSFTLTLPKKWIARQGIAPGAELSVTEGSDGSLIILPTSSELRKSKKITLASHTPSRLRTLIAGLYRRGFDSITLESKQSFDLAAIERIARSLTGMLVTHFAKTKVELECTSAVPADMNTHIAKFFITIGYMLRDHSKLKTDDVESLTRQSLESRDYLSRCISKLAFGAEKMTEYQLLIFFLEKCVSSLGRISVKESMSFNASIVDALRVALMQNDITAAQKANEQLSALRKKATNPHVSVFLDHLFSVSSRVLSIVV